MLELQKIIALCYKIYYRSFGSGKRAMIFLSGWGCDSSLWRNHALVGCLDGLADRRLFQPHTLDIPAFAIFSSFWNPQRFIAIFKKSLPRFQYQVLTGVGHYPMLETPDQVNAALTRFVASIQPELRKP